MSSNTWYRNKAWNAEVEAFFFDKISRARAQKPQYLKIQAWNLVDTAPDVAIRLTNYFRTHCQEDFWEQDVCLIESRAFYNLGDVSMAVEKVKDALGWRAKKPNIILDTTHWYAELVLKETFKKEYKPCLDALYKFHRESIFPTTQFYYFGYSAILLNRLNNSEEAKIKAVEAIEWAERDTNLLQNKTKKKLGIFRKKKSWPFSEIEKIAK